ncbi:MAG: transposase [Ignavibacteriae bacterium]|nr:transposase [Ignavibacteriota bacterium]
MNSLTFHRRNLPHFYRPNSTYFVTFRVKNSIPLDVLLQLNTKFNEVKLNAAANNIYEINNEYFFEYDNLIHKYELGYYLNNFDLANVVKFEIHKFDKKEFKLICYSIMPNHVHLIFHLLENARNVGKIMQTLKRIAAFRMNCILNKTGSFWQSESYDHIVRNPDELEKLIEYVLMNPVKAGIVEDWRDFEYNFLAEKL